MQWSTFSLPWLRRGSLNEVPLEKSLSFGFIFQHHGRTPLSSLLLLWIDLASRFPSTGRRDLGTLIILRQTPFPCVHSNLFNSWGCFSKQEREASSHFWFVDSSTDAPHLAVKSPLLFYLLDFSWQRGSSYKLNLVLYKYKLSYYHLLKHL